MSEWMWECVGVCVCVCGSMGCATTRTLNYLFIEMHANTKRRGNRRYFLFYIRSIINGIFRLSNNLLFALWRYEQHWLIIFLSISFYVSFTHSLIFSPSLILFRPSLSFSRSLLLCRPSLFLDCFRPHSSLLIQHVHFGWLYYFDVTLQALLDKTNRSNIAITKDKNIGYPKRNIIPSHMLIKYIWNNARTKKLSNM